MEKEAHREMESVRREILSEWIKKPSAARCRMAELIAEKCDMERYGVKGIYLIGSAKEYTAGPGSDIDLLIHITGDEEKKQELAEWLRGWSEWLTILLHNTAFLKPENMLDVHFITDEDIANKTSYGVMIAAGTNRAKPLRTR
jgi:pyruvate, water dikinase